jgi:hypothetical protein
MRRCTFRSSTTAIAASSVGMAERPKYCDSMMGKHHATPAHMVMLHTSPAIAARRGVRVAQATSSGTSANQPTIDHDNGGNAVDAINPDNAARVNAVDVPIAARPRLGSSTSSVVGPSRGPRQNGIGEAHRRVATDPRGSDKENCVIR